MIRASSVSADVDLLTCHPGPRVLRLVRANTSSSVAEDSTAYQSVQTKAWNVGRATH